MNLLVLVIKIYASVPVVALTIVVIQVYIFGQLKNPQFQL